MKFCSRFDFHLLLLIAVVVGVCGTGPTEIIIAEIPSSSTAIRPTNTYQRCITPTKGLGQCMHLLRCQLPEFTTDKLRFLDYFCIIDRVFVGVCCPDAFVYQLNSGQAFYGNPAGFLPAIGNDLAAIAIIEEIPNTPQQPQGGQRPNRPGVQQPNPAGGQQGQQQQGQQQRPQNPDPQNSTKKITFEDRRGCGVNQNGYYSRVVGGRPADPKQWPWMVSLIRNREHFCGGCLITDRHVLTAAHCFRGVNARTVMIRLGEHDLLRADESRTQDFRVSNAMIHKDFDSNTYENDIAILKMDRPASFNSYAWPICLPQPNAEFVGEDAIVIGWGAIEYGGPTSNVLMEVSVPVWNSTKCDDQYLQPILDTNLCAGGQIGKDSCQGDSGGPLLHQLPNGRWVTIGVVSWGIKCGEDRPAVYTKVSKYLDWILRNSAF